MLQPRFVLSVTTAGIVPAAAGTPGLFATPQVQACEAGGTSGGGCQAQYLPLRA
jgi:hypothetical protein